MPRVVVLLFSLMLFFPFTGSPARAALPVVDSQDQPLPTLAPMLEDATRAVVNIATRAHSPRQENPLLNDPYFQWFFNLPRPQQQKPAQSLGSGVIVDAEAGLILTNHHVVKGAAEIEITLKDGQALPAELVGADPDTDVALVRIPAADRRGVSLSALPLADSDRVRVGDFVVAIGNPFGLGQTVTSGIVSAVGRSGLGIEGYEDFIQTDASINPGNSGGALVDLGGHLVGINTAIIGPSGGNVGIGFAIPVNMARDVMEQLVEYGRVRRGRLGVVGQNLNLALARTLGLKDTRGVLVAQVVPGSPAETAGLSPGDVIVEVAGRPVNGLHDLHNRLGMLRVGEKTRTEIIRNGKRTHLTIAVSDRWGEQVEGERISPLLAGASLGPAEGAGVVVVEVVFVYPGLGQLYGHSGYHPMHC